MNVLIDYLTFTSRIHSIEYLIDRLGLSNVERVPAPGRYGWQYRQYYNGCHFLYGGDARDDVCVELTGIGCRIVEEITPGFNWFAFLEELSMDFISGDVHISRIDIAGDDHQRVLKFGSLTRCCRKRCFICKARYNIWIDGSEHQIYFGSPSSDRRVRIYDKALERHEDGDWMRCEMQMRNKNALSFVLSWLRSGSVGETYAGVLYDYLRFITSPVEDANYRYADVCDWWEKFVGAVRGTPQLYLEQSSYTEDTVYSWIVHCGSSIKTFLALHNGDWDDLAAIVENSRLNARQLQLLDSIRRESPISLKT